MVAEVCLGKVGAVAAREVSRFARNSREWQQLVEVCRVVDTVLIDQEMVYAPRQSNDRLLLGLKGSLNEYELDLLRQRSVEARREKARRGELIVAAPVGYLKSEDGHLEKDPDRRVQQAVLSVFEKFLELGTIRQSLLWFLEHGLELPVQYANGEIRWRRPRYVMLYRTLTHPAYGGAYTYGKTEQTIHYAQGGHRQSRRRKPQEEWLAFLPNAHEGYVSWEQFQSVQHTISENLHVRKRTRVTRHGQALLAGMLRCRRCGNKLNVRYTGCAELHVLSGLARQRLTPLYCLWWSRGRSGSCPRAVACRATGGGGGSDLGQQGRSAQARSSSRSPRARSAGCSLCGLARAQTI
jgi:hypothetical protein